MSRSQAITVLDPADRGADSPGHVVICSVGELFGGVERHILALAWGLAARRTPASLVLFNDAELAEQARRAGIDVTIVAAPNAATLRTARTLAALFAERRARVVHAHGYKATVLCALAQRSHRFALVKTEHGLLETGAGAPLAALRARCYAALETIATRSACARVCYVTRDLEARKRRASDAPTCVIANGVAAIAADALARPDELGARRFNLAIVGRLERIKGQGVAIEALAAPEMPRDVDLHIVGSGSCSQEIAALARARGVADRVHLPGFRRDALAFIAYCDALLMPSLHEGLPFALLEAMALGRPIVASRVGGLAEVIEDGVTGLLVPAGDHRALARAIVRLHGDRALATRLGENARRLQQARYSIDGMVDRYLGVYRDAAPA